VLSRRQLLRLGWTRWQIKAELRATRWRTHGRQTVAVHNGALSEQGAWWSAVFEVGSGAALDGSTALRAGGLRGFTDDVHVSTPKSARPRRPRGVVVHETRRRGPGDLAEAELPTVRPAVAAVRAALWASSNEQSALVLALCVQQRIVSADDLLTEFTTVRRHPRRRFLRFVLADLLNGAHSIGELEFARLCRDAGLPEPDRQTRRQGPRGTFYLDTEWTPYGVVVEIDGIHHLAADQVMADASRHNEITLQNSRVLRIPVLGLRLSPHTYLDQVRRLLRAAGWTG
jgi:very-short-patch-repair endonuclease